ncbi:MAG: anti-sigma F factor [Clostridia bacterium]|nr:anti-sigma F factor [Clostridia bacterium]MCX4366635.1 anti-sigma F factor [Clostridia bacterium]
MKIKARSENEAFARQVVSSFAIGMNPTIDELEDIKTVVSEAVTNSIVHAYNNDSDKIIDIKASLDNDSMEIIIEDYGVGIDDVDKAVEPFFTTKPEDERSGMGFTLMKSFMDEFELVSKLGEGTKVRMVKRFVREEENAGA